MTAWKDIVTTDFTVPEPNRPPYADPAALLRRALRADAFATGLAGPVLVVGAPALDDVLGIPAGVLVVLGVLFVCWLAALWALAARPRPATHLAGVVIAANLAWVVASVGAIAGGWLPLTGPGTAVVGVLAAAVLVFADVQILGLRRLARAGR